MTESPRSSSLYPRRDFLKLSSLAIAGLASAGAMPILAAPFSQRVSRSLISIGFASAEPQGDELVRLAPAERLLAGDPVFLSRDALVTIRSSARALKSSGESRGAAIDVVYPALGYQPDQYPVYRAWSCRVEDGGVQSSGSVAFVPVDGTQGLQLSLSNFLPESVPETAETILQPTSDEKITLSLGSNFTSPKLRRGVYVIAYRDADGGAIPSWSSSVLARRGNELVIVDAAFSYVVIRVDYAPAS
jgi:hypothetical protein